MNAKTTASNPDFSVRSLQDLPRAAPSNDARLARPIDDSDPFTRGYRRFTRQLRAAAVKSPFLTQSQAAGLCCIDAGCRGHRKGSRE